MFAALTRKGQLTRPQEVRDQLSLDADAIFDFQIQGAAGSRRPSTADCQASRCYDLSG